jgi:hypothetical protein
MLGLQTTFPNMNYSSAFEYARYINNQTIVLQDHCVFYAFSIYCVIIFFGTGYVMKKYPALCHWRTFATACILLVAYLGGMFLSQETFGAEMSWHKFWYKMQIQLMMTLLHVLALITFPFARIAHSHEN